MCGGRWRLLTVLAVAAAAGCLWVRKPYADDPLVRHRPAPRGEPIVAPSVEPIVRPAPPGSANRPRDRGVDLP